MTILNGATIAVSSEQFCHRTYTQIYSIDMKLKVTDLNEARLTNCIFLDCIGGSSCLIVKLPCCIIQRAKLGKGQNVPGACSYSINIQPIRTSFVFSAQHKNHFPTPFLV